MKWLFIILLPCIMYAQHPLPPSLYDYSMYNTGDSITVWTAQYPTVVTRLVIKIDSTFSAGCDSLRFGVGWRDTWHVDFGVIAVAEYVPGTIVIIQELPTVLYAGESIRIYRSPAGAPAGEGRVYVYPGIIEYP